MIQINLFKINPNTLLLSDWTFRFESAAKLTSSNKIILQKVFFQCTWVAFTG